MGRWADYIIPMNRATLISYCEYTRRQLHMAKAWVMRDEHRAKARELREQAHRAFTEHPHETGETYPQHLWFTVRMSLRFFYTSLVIMIHGAFPFLLSRTASDEIEKIYTIMKSRIPKDRRDVIDAGDRL